MKEPQLKERKLNIVLIGDLNPHIFQPEWFVLQKLLGEQEGSSAKIEIIHSDIAVFNIDWLRFESTRTRLVATTRDDRYHEVLRDLIVGTFTVLSHTPLKMLGINTTFDYLVNDEKTWHGIGDSLAPKDIWKKMMDTPGLSQLAIASKAVETDSCKNIVRVTVGPVNVKLGFRMHINDHYELIDAKDKSLGSGEIIDILKKEWDASQKKAVSIKDKFFEALP